MTVVCISHQTKNPFAPSQGVLPILNIVSKSPQRPSNVLPRPADRYSIHIRSSCDTTPLRYTHAHAHTSEISIMKFNYDLKCDSWPILCPFLLYLNAPNTMTHAQFNPLQRRSHTMDMRVLQSK